jgi:putative ABC transport system permease protein
MKLLSYVFRNVRRNKLRSLLTIMALAICLMLMTFLYGYLASMEAWGREAEKYNRVVVMNSQGFDGAVPLKMLDEVRAMEGVVAAVPFSWYGGKYSRGEDDDSNEFFAQFGTDPQKVFEVWSEFKISQDQLAAFQAEKQACVVDRGLAERLNLKIGDRVPLKGTIYPFDLDLKLVGIYEPTETTLSLYFNLKYLDEGLRQVGRERMAGNCGTIFFKAASADIIPALCEKIDQHYASSSNPTNTQTEKAFSQMFVKMAGNVQNFILFIAVFVTISLSLVAANGMAMSMRERTTEIAVLKAIGFSNGTVLSLMLGEAILIAALGGLLGVAAGRGIYALGHKFAPMIIATSNMPWSVMAMGMLVAAGIGLASGIVPAVIASRLSVVNGLRRII